MPYAGNWNAGHRFIMKCKKIMFNENEAKMALWATSVEKKYHYKYQRLRIDIGGVKYQIMMPIPS